MTCGKVGAKVCAMMTGLKIRLTLPLQTPQADRSSGLWLCFGKGRFERICHRLRGAFRQKNGGLLTSKRLAMSYNQTSILPALLKSCLGKPR